MLRLMLLIFFQIPVLLATGQKITGVNFVAEKTNVDSNAFEDLKAINPKWMSWSPYAFCDINTGNVNFNHKWQWEGESLKGTTKAIKLAKESGLKVMIKPHVWMSDNSYTGTIKLSDSSWVNWKSTYKKYIMSFAELAQKQEVDMFCIGTEQYASIKQNTKYWFRLIDEIKKVYKGKLIYAGNWDSYRFCPFWSKLDYIGVDAYFPLSTRSNPSVKQIKREWSLWKKQLADITSRYNKQIVFTECGYKASEYTTVKPWEHDSKKKHCEQCQANAIDAMFQSIWGSPWFAGGFIWKWFEHGKSSKQSSKNSFCFQGKIAEKLISREFEKLN
ncbi:MAG: hypothetical protein ACJA0Q_001375 [Saprospiraceae bacterium]|jgi:hypothetical protein